MRIPKELTGEAKAFWVGNAPEMIEDGRLTKSTLFAFKQLCQTYGDYQQADRMIDRVCLGKQVNQGYAAFGMTPASRKRLKLDVKTSNIADVLRDAMGEDAE